MATRYGPAPGCPLHPWRVATGKTTGTALGLPVRLALLDERADALGGVRAQHVARDRLARLAVGLDETRLELFYEQLEARLVQAYGDASKAITRNMLGADAAEGVGAFIEKRKPNWQS